MKIKVTKKQNVRLDGVKFVAEDVLEDMLEEYCDGCAFMSVEDCSGFPCRASERKDYRNVIFVKKGGAEMKIEVSGDQNTVTVDDVKSVASIKKNGCSGCAFDQGLYCAVPAAPCEGDKRKDERPVIFVKSDAQPAPKPVAALAAEMTLRDYFAGRAIGHVISHCTYSKSAKEAYKIADAMLKARGA